MTTVFWIREAHCDELGPLSSGTRIFTFIGHQAKHHQGPIIINELIHDGKSFVLPVKSMEVPVKVKKMHALFPLRYQMKPENNL